MPLDSINMINKMAAGRKNKANFLLILAHLNRRLIGEFLEYPC